MPRRPFKTVIVYKSADRVGARVSPY